MLPSKSDSSILGCEPHVCHMASRACLAQRVCLAHPRSPTPASCYAWYASEVVALLYATSIAAGSCTLEYFEDSSPWVQVRGVVIPELDLLRVAHTCTITTEMRNNMAGQRSCFPGNWDE